MIYASVAEWGGPGFEGHDPTPENVAKLPPSIVNQFADAARRINSEMLDTEKKA